MPLTHITRVVTTPLRLFHFVFLIFCTLGHNLSTCLLPFCVKQLKQSNFMASKSTATAVLPALSSAPPPPPNGGVRRQREDDEYNASSSSTAAAAARIARMTTESVPRSAEGDETNANNNNNNNNNNNRAEGGSSSHHRQHQQHQQRHSGGAVATSDSNRHHQQQPHVPEGGGTSIVASFAHSPYARGPGYGLHRESSSSELEQQALGGATTGGNSAPPYRSEIRRSNGAFAPNSNSTENDAVVGHRSRRAEGDPHQHAYYAGEAALSASPLMLGADSASGSSINRSRHGRGHNGNNQAASSAASQPFHHYLPSSRRPHNHNPSASMVSHHPNHQHNHMFQPQQFSPFLEPAVVGSSNNSNSADNFAPQASSLLLDHRRSEYQQGGTSWGSPSSSTTHGGNQNYPAHHHHPYDIQREFAVLQSSFAELQHQYGQKCGEVIVLQNTVAVLRDQLQEFEFVRQQQQQQPQQSSAPPFTTSTVPTGGAAGSRNASSAAGRLRQRCPSADVSSGDDDGHSQRPAASATGVPAADIPDTFSSSVQAAGPNKHALNSNAPQQQQQQHPLKGASGAVLFCDLCQISVNSDTTLRAHLQGERHRKALHRAGAAVAAATAVPPGGEEPVNNASDVIANNHSPEQASALPNDAMMMADPVELSAASTTTITPDM
ncbi:GPI-anchored surface protein, putative [Bodo saltans]|uniref:GPI-anchored surface protein, putative n=1 Tax=Bodo saltans TaxID=75058 RepID=A0A0S4JF68_BODSA|nr:GPI-anchored surface protein, putative [Bodo saltans]|eukprot:CUG90134.1 GPI-anchored surface protein, putative [Bodo saltans]